MNETHTMEDVTMTSTVPIVCNGASRFPCSVSFFVELNSTGERIGFLFVQDR